MSIVTMNRTLISGNYIISVVTNYSLLILNMTTLLTSYCLELLFYEFTYILISNYFVKDYKSGFASSW